MGGKPCLVTWSPDDWLGDDAVAALNCNARGVWFEILNLLYKNDLYAITGTPDQIARQCRASVPEIVDAIGQIAITETAIVEAKSLGSGEFENVLESGNVRFCSKNFEQSSLLVRITSRRLLKRYNEKAYDRERMRKKRGVRSESVECPSRAYAGNGKGIGKKKNNTISNPSERGSAEGENETLTQNPEAWQTTLESLRAEAAASSDYTHLLQAAERATYLGEDETDDSIHLAAANPADKFTLSLGRNNLAHFADVSEARITLAPP